MSHFGTGSITKIRSRGYETFDERGELGPEILQSFLDSVEYLLSPYQNSRGERLCFHAFIERSLDVNAFCDFDESGDHFISQTFGMNLTLLEIAIGVGGNPALQGFFEVEGSDFDIGICDLPLGYKWRAFSSVPEYYSHLDIESWCSQHQWLLISSLWALMSASVFSHELSHITQGHRGIFGSNVKRERGGDNTDPFRQLAEIEADYYSLITLLKSPIIDLIFDCKQKINSKATRNKILQQALVGYLLLMATMPWLDHSILYKEQDLLQNGEYPPGIMRATEAALKVMGLISNDQLLIDLDKRGFDLKESVFDISVAIKDLQSEFGGAFSFIGLIREPYLDQACKEYNSNKLLPFAAKFTELTKPFRFYFAE